MSIGSDFILAFAARVSPISNLKSVLVGLAGSIVDRDLDRMLAITTSTMFECDLNIVLVAVC